MPRRREPESLKRLCMKMVAKYFEAICYPIVHPRIIGSTDFKKWVDDDIFMKTKPHFNKLDAAVIEELLQVVRKSRILQKHHVHMLVTRNTRRIKLGFGVIEDSYALKFLKERARNLQHLDLSSLHHLNPQLLIEAISSFPTLVYLNLGRTSAVNQVTATIGKYCPDIQDLDISYTEITDKGILALIHGQGAGRQAQKLSRLNIRGLELNPSTVTFILQNLPNLLTLEAENLFAGFKALKGKKLSIAGRRMSTNLANLNADKLGLNTLISTVPEIESVDIFTSIQMSPLVTNLVLMNSELPADDMEKFALIQNLRSIDFTNNPQNKYLTFTSSVLPLLRMKGHQLESISLTYFADVCVKKIGALCPKLKRLLLSHVDNFDAVASNGADAGAGADDGLANGGSSSVPSLSSSSSLATLGEEADDDGDADGQRHRASAASPPYSNLEDFELICEFYGSVPRREHLLACLRNALGLKRILIKACTTADDAVFSELLQVNPLGKLQKLSLDFCPITTKTARQFLELDNDLHYMTVCDTGGIDLKSYREMTIRVKERNLDVYIEWSL